MIGSKLGPYEITAKLGEGGMGEVYRATDTKLKRDVAIKVLPAAFTEDKERLARFEREAQLLAQLHHPNIASIFGMEESEGTRALVMELVEGPTLAERLEQGPLPFNECLSVSLQIAQALEEAHEKGIIHRDLKPQNVKASIEGKVKVLDFGLAKAMDPAAGSAASAADMARSPTLMQSPTLTAVHGTQLGVILGTAAYMAPEQAKGLPIDKRADIWAFGVVLYEMLVGRSLFAGDTVTDTLAGVLKTEIDFGKLPSSTPTAVRRLLRSCLERNPKSRLRDIGDARIALEEALATPGRELAMEESPQSGGSRSKLLGALPWLVAAVALAVAGWAVASRSGHGGVTGGAERQTYVEISMPPGVEAVQGIAGGFGLSPDGRTLGLIGVREGVRRLYVRSLDEPEAVEVAGSSGVNSVAFSPDGASVAFVVGTLEIVRYSIADRQRQSVASGADLGSTVAWGESGIYFSRDGAIWRVRAEGGEPDQITRLDAGRHEVIHIDPLEPPGSGRLVFASLASGAEAPRIESVALADGSRSVVLDRAATPVWSPPGCLLFEREGAVWAIRFDARSGATSGRAVRVIEAGVLGSLRYGSLPFRLSTTGTLAYMPRQFDEKRMIAVDRRGAELAFAVPPDAYGNPRSSPDGRRLLFENGNRFEVFEIGRGTRTQLAAGAFGSNFGTWTSDGRQVVLRRFNTPHWIAMDGSGRAGLVPGGSVNDYPHASGPDPDSFLAVRVRPVSSGDVYLFSISGAFEPRPLVATPAYEGGAQLSPDGQWLIYQSNETGQPEIYVRRYPQLDRAWQVSEGGGVQTRWSADGGEIFYRTGAAIMAASFAGDGGEPRLGRPQALFTDEYDFGQGLSVPNYDVLADGRFVFFRRTPAGGRFRLVQSWNQELEKQLAAQGER